MPISVDFWRGRRVLLTGHTGFKGAWLGAWLTGMGARVSALSLAPEGEGHLHGVLRVAYDEGVIGDIREPAAIAELARRTKPEIVLHLAAQALVRRSYADPCETFATNVVGTAHVLNALRGLEGLRAALIVTTDKVYENLEAGEAFREDDRLGGHDPYSASKACTEIVATSFRRSFFSRSGARVATARAGNVIGGGDWSADRIIPDLLRASAAGRPVPLRYPQSVRPWQHVLEPLAGYLAMAEAMATSNAFREEALNFAPDPANERTVRELVETFTRLNGGKPGWVQDPGDHPHEAGILKLSAARASETLGWKPLLDFEETVAWTVNWHRAMEDGEDMRAYTFAQIRAYAERLGGGARLNASPPP